MAKQPWQESKKKNNGDINREIKRAEIKREERAQAKVLEAKIKKTRQMGVMTLLVGFMLYLFSGSVTSGATADMKLFQVLSSLMVAISGVAWIFYGRYSKQSQIMWLIIGIILIIAGAVLCAIVLI